jgi:ureidoacrylate peracid hydrolase
MKVEFNSRPRAIELDLRSAAMVVVDMQNAFASKGGVFDLAGLDISHCAQIIDVIRRILQSARAAGMTVVYLQMGYRKDLRDSGGPNSPGRRGRLQLRTTFLRQMRCGPKRDGIHVHYRAMRFAIRDSRIQGWA